MRKMITHKGHEIREPPPGKLRIGGQILHIKKTISMTARFGVLRECKILIRIPCVN